MASLANPSDERAARARAFRAWAGWHWSRSSTAHTDSFSPSQISGLAAWYKADGTLWQDSARTVPATANNDPVGAWDDASGNGNHALQATAGNRPLLSSSFLNGKPGIAFDGSNDMLKRTGVVGGPLAQPVTFFFAGKNASTAVQQMVAFAGLAFYVGNSSTWRIGGSLEVLWGPADTNNRVFAAVFNGASSKLWVAGGSAASGNVGTGTVVDVNLGSGSAPSEWSSTTMAEVLLYTGALSLANINLVGAYLGTKYGISWATAT